MNLYTVKVLEEQLNIVADSATAAEGIVRQMYREGTATPLLVVIDGGKAIIQAGNTIGEKP